MPTLRLKFDSSSWERLVSAASALGYSGPEEMAAHILERELDRLAPGEEEPEEEVRRKLEGLGYMG